jgi:hypothetical protein
MKIKHDLNAWVKSLYDVEKSTRYHVNDFRSWIEKRTKSNWSTTQLINKSMIQLEDEEKSRMIAIIQANDWIESFRASLSIEIKREVMKFVIHSNQRLWLL